VTCDTYVDAEVDVYIKVEVSIEVGSGIE